MSVRLVWRTDVHLSDHTPQSRKDNWTDAVIDNLQQVGRIAEERKAHAVIDGGDFFDVKQPTRNSHRLVRLTAKVHNDHYKCPVYANVGNHDVKHSKIKWLPDQPLGVLFETGIFEPLYDEHEAVFEDEVTVRVVGIPYHGVRYDLDRFRAIERHDEDYLIVTAHVLASPDGGSMFEGEDIIKYADLVDLNPNVDCWAFGHWHKDQGITEIAPNKWIINTGSLTRGSLSQDNLERTPCAVLMEFVPEGMTLTRIPLNVKPAHEILDVEGKERAELRSDIMDNFVSSIKTTLEASKARSLEDVVESLDHVSSTVRERVLDYIEGARK